MLSVFEQLLNGADFVVRPYRHQRKRDLNGAPERVLAIPRTVLETRAALLRLLPRMERPDPLDRSKPSGYHILLNNLLGAAASPLRPQKAHHVLYSVICLHEMIFKIKTLQWQSTDFTFCFISANDHRLLVYSASAAPVRTPDLTFSFWFTFCILSLYSTGLMTLMS